jgi:hypothetical protein
MIMKKLSTLLVSVVLFSLPVMAQEHCDPGDTLSKCWEKLGNAFPVSQAASPMTTAAPMTKSDASKVAAAQSDATQKSMASINTGVPAIASQTGSALADFLSLLSATLQTSSFKSEGDTLTFDYNPPISLLGKENALKFEAVFAKPKLNDKVNTGLATNAAALKKFDDSLSNTDDATFSAAFQPTGKTFGRSIGPHRTMFEDMEIAVVLSRANALVKNNVALVAAVKAANVFTVDPLMGTLSDKDRETFEDAARQQAALRKSLGSFDRAFIKLLNNQPQLYFNATFEGRRNIVGPNEWSQKLTYEMKGRNLNGFRKGPGAGCASAAEDDKKEKCAAALVAYADEPTLRDDGLAFSAEYHRVNRRWIADTDTGLAFGYPRARSVVYSIGAQRREDRSLRELPGRAGRR